MKLKKYCLDLVLTVLIILNLITLISCMDNPSENEMLNPDLSISGDQIPIIQLSGQSVKRSPKTYSQVLH